MYTQHLVIYTVFKTCSKIFKICFSIWSLIRLAPTVPWYMLLKTFYNRFCSAFLQDQPQMTGLPLEWIQTGNKYDAYKSLNPLVQPVLPRLAPWRKTQEQHKFIKFEVYSDWQFKCLMWSKSYFEDLIINKSSCSIYRLVTRINISTVGLINLSFSCNPNFRLNIFKELQTLILLLIWFPD